MAVLDRVQALIVEQLGIPQADVTPAARLVEDLQADAVHRTEILMAVEEEFGFEFPSDDVRVVTVQDIVDYVLRLAGSG
jgi:acyl carrier protein